MKDSAAPSRSNGRRTIAVLLFLAIAATAWLSLHLALRQVGGVSRHGNPLLDPGYQHSERLRVATARAAMDAVGMNSSDPDAPQYRADYHRQRMQIEADSQGLERWAANDPHHQGLLLEIRGSLAELTLSLDQVSGTGKSADSAAKTPLLPALSRAESALGNYSASLTEPSNFQTAPYIFSGPVVLWWLLLLLLLEAAAMVWVVYSTTALRT